MLETKNMKLEEAIHAAKDHVERSFADEGIEQIGLEEIEFDNSERTWKVTIGFKRKFKSHMSMPLIETTDRTYRVVTISDEDREVRSVKVREFA